MGLFKKQDKLNFTSTVAPEYLWTMKETIGVEQATVLIELLLRIQTKNMAAYLRVRELIEQNNLWQRLENTLVDPAYLNMLHVLSDVNQIFSHCEQATSVADDKDENLINALTAAAMTVADDSSDYLTFVFRTENDLKIAGGKIGGKDSVLVDLPSLKILQELSIQAIRRELEADKNLKARVIPVFYNHSLESGKMVVENLQLILRTSGLTFYEAVVNSSEGSTVVYYR